MPTPSPRPWAHVTLSTLIDPFARPVRTGHLARRLSSAVLPARAAGLAEDTQRAATAGEARALAGVRAEIGGAHAVQRDPTTCGSASLVVLAALGDPELERWIAEGTEPTAPRPEIPDAARSAELAELAEQGLTLDSPEHRFDAAQRLVKAATSHRALGVADWPDSLGTPPWAAAREARFPGVRYRWTPVDDRSERAAHVLAAVHSATLAGLPVPLYTSGDLGGGLGKAVPRHVVLARPAQDRGSGPGLDASGAPALTIYDPSRGLDHLVPVADLLARSTPLKALGSWSHVVIALLPVPRAG
ncbi:hypothetical protein ACPYO6_14330 [Georgenia sp. Z1344]|uniref:hypothetical protein n=1 Tax=Georgenia sp. Z1344 TaxID=3416706 RepID=UPI003CF47F07